MTDQEIRTFEMFKRVRVFYNAHSGNFPAGDLGRELFDATGQAIDELVDYAAAQSAASGSARQKTAGKAASVELLSEQMEAYRRTARAMGYTTPGLEDKFRIPRGAGVQVLINTARAFVQEALPLKAEFIRHGMPADFIERLQATIDDVENATRDQSASKGAQKRATASIDGAIERGLQAVRRLDPIVRNKFADQPAVLSEWQSARHIQRGPRSQPDTGGDTTPPPPPAP